MKALKYSDITLMPTYSALGSRSYADTSIKFGGKKFNLPVVPANMRAVIDLNRARQLSDNDYFYIMHRFDMDPVSFCSEASTLKTISISVGVKEKDQEQVTQLAKSGLKVDFITIDIAHGHSLLMKKMIAHIKRHLPDVFIIAGNVATRDAIIDLEDWGANCIKVGIGQGLACTTKDKTGFTYPMFSSMLECSSVAKVPLIADGGVKANGDIAKAIRAGATLVMAGSIFSQCSDSPAPTIMKNGRIYKQYFGSASERNKGHGDHIEGVVREIESNGMKYEDKYKEITQDLQSSISYAGGNMKNLLSINYRQI
jgi:GMP reductase